MSEREVSKEERILRAVKLTLTNVIKDTATQPGMRHPLSDGTIQDLRNCLQLISSRESELVEAAGGSMDMRPHFIDEPKVKDKVVVSLASMMSKDK